MTYKLEKNQVDIDKILSQLGEDKPCHQGDRQGQSISNSGRAGMEADGRPQGPTGQPPGSIPFN